MLIALKKGHESVVKALLTNWVKRIAFGSKDFDVIWDIGTINEISLALFAELLGYLHSELKRQHLNFLRKYI